MDPVPSRSIPETLRGRRIVVGVTGGVAAFKACSLVSTLVQGGARVRVVMTPEAERFVSSLTLASLSQNPTVKDMWAGSEEGQEQHVELAEWAEALLIYPATARTIGRIALGLADEALSATAMATAAPVVVAPAMYDRMYAHPATQHNLETLVRLGATIVPPRSGRLASGRDGQGRLAPEEDAIEALARVLAPQSLLGERVVVTAGGTREPLDAVRFISNRSSGKMGFALARAAARRGAEVTLITTVAPPAPLPGVTLHFVETAEEMGRALMDGLETADVILMAAAVADYRAVRPADGKPPKAAERLNLELTANPDLVAGLSRVRREHRPFLVAFAAEAGDPLPSAREKLRRKGADLIVANDISAGDSGMGSDFNQVSILAPSGHRWDVPRAAKDIVAEAILDAVAEARAEIAPRSRSARRKPAPR